VVNQNQARVGVVAIGRNEGDRLKRCIDSIPEGIPAIYVDSGSSDGSAHWARERGLAVVDLDMRVPFTAARARNIGFRHLRKLLLDLPYVQFIDADCELDKAWLQHAMGFLDFHPEVAGVAGQLRERHPERSIYNWLCDQEWNGPVGEAKACGGIAMFRVDALEAVGAFRENLIAGEEPELCVRLRARKWRIWRLEANMASHDAAMTRFGQWWRRAVRSGYAYAMGAHLHGAPPERHWVWESRRAWLWGIIMPLACAAIGILFNPWGWLVWLIFPLQIIRQSGRNQGLIRDRVALAIFQMLARFAEALGQLKFLGERLFGHRVDLIEYK